MDRHASRIPGRGRRAIVGVDQLGVEVNLRGRSEVEVTLRGRRLPASAELVEVVDAVARVYQALICEQGYAKAGRRMGIRINVDRVPTQEELVEAARRDGLSLIYLQVGGTVR